jgi:hypothetical protein
LEARRNRLNDTAKDSEEERRNAQDGGSTDRDPEQTTNRRRDGSAPYGNDGEDLIETYNDLKESLEGPFPLGRVETQEFAPDDVAQWELPDIQQPSDGAHEDRRQRLS